MVTILKKGSDYPVLASLHWLPVPYKIRLKILLFAFKALTWTYNMDSWTTLIYSVVTNRFSDCSMVLIKLKGDHVFAVATLRLWKSLQLDLQPVSNKNSNHIKMLAFK